MPLKQRNAVKTKQGNRSRWIFHFPPLENVSSKLKARQIFESQVQIYANLLSQPERRKIR